MYRNKQTNEKLNKISSKNRQDKVGKLHYQQRERESEYLSKVPVKLHIVE